MSGSYVRIFSKAETCKTGPVLFRGHVLCEPAELPLVKTVNVSLLILLIPIAKKTEKRRCSKVGFMST